MINYLIFIFGWNPVKIKSKKYITVKYNYQMKLTPLNFRSRYY